VAELDEDHRVEQGATTPQWWMVWYRPALPFSSTGWFLRGEGGTPMRGVGSWMHIGKGRKEWSWSLPAGTADTERGHKLMLVNRVARAQEKSMGGDKRQAPVGSLGSGKCIASSGRGGGALAMADGSWNEGTSIFGIYLFF
jgi:hypothetical protein